MKTVVALFALSLLGDSYQVAKPKSGAKAQAKRECTPGESGGTITGGDITQHVMVCSADGQWTEDATLSRKFTEEILEREKHQKALYWSLQTRVLSPTEEKEADSFGRWLNLFSGESYQEEEKAKELMDAWYQQRRLQRLSKAPCAQIKDDK